MEKVIQTSGLPQDPAIVRRMASYMLEGAKLGVKLDPEEVVEIVREDIFAELKSLASKLGIDKLEELVGKDALNAIRKKNNAKAKTITPATAKAATANISAAEKSSTKAPQGKSIKDIFGI